MARPVHRTARKDYPDNGIAKGDQYWYVKIKTGPRSSRVMRSKTPFSRSQLTQSDYLAQLYDWEDGKAAISSMDEAQEFADTIQALGDEQGEKLDNMPEGLQQGDSGQMLEARRDACAAATGEIEEIIGERESAKDTWDTEIETYKTDLDAYREQERKTGAEDEEVTEPDLPEHTAGEGDDASFDEEDFLDRIRDVSVDE
jgi:hypothetical protein